MTARAVAAPRPSLTALGLTPSQTVGPFFHGLLRAGLNVLVTTETEGQRIRVEGHVHDGDGAPIDDAMVEIWQANAHGRYRHPADQGTAPLDPAFIGFGRSGTDAAGFFWFETIKPGPVPFDARNSDARNSEARNVQAPHVNVIVTARGLLDHLLTRLYFDDEAANAQDPILRLVPEERRQTLLARKTEAGDRIIYRFDLVLQGEQETVFFDP